VARKTATEVAGVEEIDAENLGIQTKGGGEGVEMGQDVPREIEKAPATRGGPSNSEGGMNYENGGGKGTKLPANAPEVKATRHGL